MVPLYFLFLSLFLLPSAAAYGENPRHVSPNVPCRPMHEYLPARVSAEYDMSRHNGTWFEVAFRDLYPWGPLCDCQQSIKYVNKEKGYIDDYFVFTCYPLKLNYISPQRENVTVLFRRYC